MKIFIATLICAVTSTAISQGVQSTVLFDISGAQGAVYSDVYWNSLTASYSGPGSTPHLGNFNTVVAEGSGMTVGSVYTSTGIRIEDALTWQAVNTYSTGSGLWGSTGQAGTTDQTYLTLPDTVMTTAYSFNNGAKMTFTIGGLQAGQNYTLSFGGNHGGSSTSEVLATGAVNFTFNNMVAGSLTGVGGTVSDSKFQVTNPQTTAYSLQVVLTANDNGEISFVGLRNSAVTSNVNMTYMSLTGDWNLVPEPSSYALGLFGLAGLAMRRRRA